MKRPQRNFLVEYKSSRQQTKPRANSIWGDADLKALARELEDQSNPIFTSHQPSDMPVGGGGMGAVTNYAGPDLDSDSTTPPPVLPMTDVLVETQQKSEPEAPPAAPVIVAADQVRRTAKQPEKRYPKLRQKRAKPVVSGPIEVDELVLLEAENRRLKKLLAETLRAENTQLRRMLERF